MENNEKHGKEKLTKLEDEHLHHSSGGGGNITYLVCSVCSAELPYSRYGYEISINKCPKCGGRIVLWR